MHLTATAKKIFKSIVEGVVHKFKCKLIKLGMEKLRPATTFCAARGSFKQIIKKIFNFFTFSTNFIVIAIKEIKKLKNLKHIKCGYFVFRDRFILGSKIKKS